MAQWCTRGVRLYTECSLIKPLSLQYWVQSCRMLLTAWSPSILTAPFKGEAQAVFPKNLRVVDDSSFVSPSAIFSVFGTCWMGITSEMCQGTSTSRKWSSWQVVLDQILDGELANSNAFHTLPLPVNVAPCTGAKVL